MGITWISDVLSWVFGIVWNSDSSAVKNSNMHSTRGDIHYFWYVMDAINAMQGVLIFLVVASQPQVSYFEVHHTAIEMQNLNKFSIQFKGYFGNCKIFRSKK